MLQHWKLFGIALIATLIIDYIWLGLIAKDFYLRQYGELARTENGQFKPLLLPALIVYLLLATAVVAFALPRISAEDSLMYAFMVGALLGLVIYGVFDMTNLSTLQKWPLTVSLVDMAWGTLLGGMITTIAKWSRDSWLS